MSIKCGRCGSRHESVADVRSCYNGQPVASEPNSVPAAQALSPKQVRYVRNLLHELSLEYTGTVPVDQLPRYGAGRDLLDGLIAYKQDPERAVFPPNVRWDSGRMSADGNPEGYGDPLMRRSVAVSERTPGPSLRGRTDRVRPIASENDRIPDVPAGHYAVPSATGNNDLDFYRVDRPSEGRWHNYTFVKRVIGGHADTPVRGSERRSALERILKAGPYAAAVLYGQKLGRCYRCNRHLTDELSRHLGIGPDCRSK